MSAIDPANVVAPSIEVAEATNRLISDLASLRQREGGERAQVEAMAMHNAAVAVLRPDVGTDGVRQILQIAGVENDRIAARDVAAQDVARRRERAARQRSGALQRGRTK